MTTGTSTFQKYYGTFDDVGHQDWELYIRESCPDNCLGEDLFEREGTDYRFDRPNKQSWLYTAGYKERL